MPIPDYQTLMLPLLKFASDGGDHATREAVEGLATEFQLTPAERNELLASGQQAIVNNRIGWANSYLKKILTRLQFLKYNKKFGTNISVFLQINFSKTAYFLV